MDGRVAIVTGGGQGIGRAIAEKLAEAGAEVVVADLNEVTAKETADAIGGGALGVRTDVTDQQAVIAMVEQAHAKFGQIDVLVNNAGWDDPAPFVETDRPDWDKVIAINLYSVLYTCRAVLPIMLEQGRGTVVNVASDAGRVGSSGEAAYSAAKGGVIAFTKTIARETARKGINANVICPGPTDTALFAIAGGDSPKLRDALTRTIPAKRLGLPSDVAAAVAFFASPEASFITGQTVSVSGGLVMS
jgi:2-hydroxycyclohexanecarboxyl-CoA dehydrogenase